MDSVLTGTPELEQMQFDYDVAATAVEAATRAMTRALEEARTRIRDDLGEAEAQAASLGNVADELPDTIEKIAVARGSAKVAAYHAPSVKMQGDDIVAAIKQIAAWEKGLLKLHSEVQAMEAGMDKTMDAQWKLTFAFHEQVTQALKCTAELASIGPPLTAALESTKTQALQRVEQRNPDGLSLYQDDARRVDVKRFKSLLAKLTDAHDEVLALQERVGAKPREGRKADLAALKRDRAAAELRLAGLQAMQQQILALKVVPIDIAKALKVLGLPGQHKAALTQALAKPPNQREKALDDVARQAKVALKGKAWLQALERAKVV